MKKMMSMILAGTMMVATLAGCGAASSSATPAPSTGAAPASSVTASAFDNTNDITVVSREDGSGTRGAFIELFGIEVKDADGKKIDHTVDTADITNSTAVMMTSVAGNPYAIGYISLGSLDDSVKALEIDGAVASAEDIKAGTYKIVRPFNIATKGTPSAVTQDFIDFILSTEGQAVVAEAGYISSDSAAYAGAKPTGKIVIAGSSSITPVMEKLQEAYLKLNANATIELQQSDSTTGMTSATEGTCDIGMASRELKESELAAGLTPVVIAQDGIAVIASLDCPLTGLTSDQVRSIFTGETITWAEIA